MSAWPFLFAAGKFLDYQLIVCPQPLANKEQMGAFRRWVAPLAEHLTSAPTRAESRDPSTKHYVIFYSCEPATVKDMPVTDCSHRPVHVVTGLLFDKFDATSADFDARAKEMVVRARALLWLRLESFWDRITPPAKVEISEPVIPHVRTPLSPILPQFVRLTRLRAEVLASGLAVDRVMAAAAAVVFTAGIVAGVFFFHQPTGDIGARAIGTPRSPAGDVQSAQRHASKLLGTEIFDSKSRPVGTIRDLVIDPDGKVGLVIVNVDGEVGPSGKPVGIDLHHITPSNGLLVLDLTREQLSAAPEYHAEEAIGTVGSAFTVDGSQPGSSQSGK